MKENKILGVSFNKALQDQTVQPGTAQCDAASVRAGLTITPTITPLRIFKIME